ncbi:hypothetical protein GW17_00060593, partial [Ensete ventricosum]
GDAGEGREMEEMAGRVGLQAADGDGSGNRQMGEMEEIVGGVRLQVADGGGGGNRQRHECAAAAGSRGGAAVRRCRRSGRQ